jgi:hypothetical protein
MHMNIDINSNSYNKYSNSIQLSQLSHQEVEQQMVKIIIKE